MSFCSFLSLFPMKQLFSRQLSLPKTCVSSIPVSSSPKVFDLDGCLSSENPTIIMAILLCGRVLRERAPRLLLRFREALDTFNLCDSVFLV